jgi:hypothetical protein
MCLVRVRGCLRVEADDADLVEFGGPWALCDSKVPLPLFFLVPTYNVHRSLPPTDYTFILDAIAMLGMQGLSLACSPRDGLGLPFSLALRFEV